MKNFQYNPGQLLTGLILLTGFLQLNAQTLIYPGEVSGTWTKKSSPYLIKGDLNIPAGKTLTVQPGVIVKFTGLFMINVQGSLVAEGIEKDSIIFTVTDTTGIKSRNRTGWSGIRFDRRPVIWDTLKFKMPKDEALRRIIESKMKNKEIDTATKISLIMKMPDAVNDTQIPESFYTSKLKSRITYCRFEYAIAEGKAQPYIFGGAIYIYRYSNLLISNCLFEYNTAWAGGAIYCKEAAPVIANNRFIKCLAHSSGGSMVFVHSGPIIMNNVINENRSGYNGGAVLFYESSPYVVNNTFFGNNADNSGGAVYIEQKGNAFRGPGNYNPVTKVKFPRDPAFENESLNKTAPSNTTSLYGRFINNVIINNRAVTGGGISLFATMPEFNSLTLCDNRSDSAGGGIYCNVSAPRVINSILYGNLKEQVYLIGKSRPCFQFCNIESETSGICKDSTCKEIPEYSNITSAPPKFYGPARGDYSLSKGSECIDAGIPDTTSLKLPKVDLSGNNRIVNSRIDIGALEYTGNKVKLKSTEEEVVSQNTNGLETEMYTSVFPNPNGGFFSIVIHNNKYESITVKIFTQSGQLVYIENLKADKWFEKEIDMARSIDGIYNLIIYSDEVLIYNGEIIINK